MREPRGTTWGCQAGARATGARDGSAQRIEGRGCRQFRPKTGERVSLMRIMVFGSSGVDLGLRWRNSRRISARVDKIFGVTVIK